MKKHLALLIILAMTFGLAACSGPVEPDSSAEPKSDPEQDIHSDTADAPFELDLGDYTVYTTAGSDGEGVCSADDFSLTEEEIEQLKTGGYSVAFCYHELEDQCNNAKLAAASAQLEEWGIEIVATTNAGYNVERQISDIESVLALEPDVVFVMPTDANALASTCEAVEEAGSELVFMEMSADISKDDYVAVVANDYYGVGVNCAHLMAKGMDYKGTVAMCYYDANWFSCTQRDDGFKDTMEKYYPDIEIVMEIGFTDSNETTTQGEAIFAAYPDIDGVYCTWDVPMEGIIAAAKAVGRSDLIAVAPDLSDNTARRLAEGDQIMYASVAPKSYQCGITEAYVAAYALLGKEVPAQYVAVPAQMIMHENLAEAYKIIYNTELPSDIETILNG